MKGKHLILISTIFILLISSCSNGGKKTLTNVRLTTSKNMWCSLTFIAYEKKFFEEEGLKAELQYTQGGRYCMDALLSNSADFGNTVEVNIAYLGYTGNQSISVIGSMVTSTSLAIIAKKSSGINKPEDLKGKKIALSPAMTSDVFAYRFFEKYNIDMNDVDIRPVQPIAIQTAILAKDGIDGASAWEPFRYNIRQSLGDDAIEFKEPSIYTGYSTITVRKDWAITNSDIVIRYLRAIRKAEDFVKSNKEESQHIISKAIDLDLEVVKSTWDQYKMTLAPTPEILDATIKIGEWVRLVKEDYKNKPLPDYTIYYDNDFYDQLTK